MKKLRVGVVGCGEIAQVMHLPFLKELPQFELAAICDISETIVAKLGDQYEVARRYTDYRELVKQEDLDIVAVLTIDHPEVALAAIAEGKHVLVEKPLCFDPADGRRMVEAAKQHNVKLMVGYMKRYDPGYESGLEHIQTMNDVRMLHVHDFAGDFSVTKKLYSTLKADDIADEVIAASELKLKQDMQAALGSSHAHLSDIYSTLLMLSSHDLSVMRGVFGSPASVLYSESPFRNTLVSMLDFGENRRCYFEIGVWTRYRWWDQHLKAYGKEEIVTIDFKNPYVKYTPTRVTVQTSEMDKPITKQIEASFDEAFRREWIHFYDCIVDDLEPRTSGEDGLADVELAVEMIRAIKV